MLVVALEKATYLEHSDRRGSLCVSCAPPLFNLRFQEDFQEDIREIPEILTVITRETRLRDGAKWH